MSLGLCAIGARPLAQFSSGVSLVEVYATVTDAAGQPVTGLTRADFIVEEDGERQTIAAFAPGDVPLSLAIGIDRSFSVAAARLTGAVAAVRSLLDGLRPDDRAMILAIGSQPEILAPLSADRGAARAALASIQPWGTTPLYDATTTAIDAIQSTSGRRALILLSDGEDRYSGMKAAETVAHARERDVIVYPVALGRTRPAIFAELAAVTGGRSFQAADDRAVSSALGVIARELRAQYLIGYVPPADGQPGWRSIHVTTRQANLKVRARDGYYARP